MGKGAYQYYNQRSSHRRSTEETYRSSYLYATVIVHRYGSILRVKVWKKVLYLILICHRKVFLVEQQLHPSNSIQKRERAQCTSKPITVYRNLLIFVNALVYMIYGLYDYDNTIDESIDNATEFDADDDEVEDVMNLINSTFKPKSPQEVENFWNVPWSTTIFILGTNIL